MQTISNPLVEMLHKQAHVEMQTSLLYLQYAYWFDNHDYEGAGTFFKKESEEERKHCIQILDFLNVRDYRVTIDPQLLDWGDKEKLTFEKPGEIFELYQKREESNYRELEKIAQVALEDKEPGTIKFINRMLEDQIASCNEVNKIHTKSKAYSAVPGLFFHLDKELHAESHNFDTWKQ